MTLPSAKSHSHTLEDSLGKLFYHYTAPTTENATSTLTLINGYLRTHSDFKIWRQKFSNAGYGVLTLDNRASGLSEVQKDFDFSEFSNDIKMLWQKLEIHNSHVLGISMGGIIAQFLACQQPQKLSSLILVSTLGTDQHFTPLQRPHPPHNTPLWHPVERYFSPTFAKKHPLMVNMLRSTLKRHEQDPQLLKQLHHQKKAFSEACYQNILHHHITCPTLIIHGSQDRVVRPEAARELSTLIQNSELKYYPDAGHLLLAENSPKLYTDALTFIESHTPKKDSHHEA